MKIYVYVPNMPRPRNVMLLATAYHDEPMTLDDAECMIAPFETANATFDQSTVNDDDPDLLRYVFTDPERPTFIIAPDHVTDEFVASQFDSTD